MFHLFLGQDFPLLCLEGQSHISRLTVYSGVKIILVITMAILAQIVRPEFFMRS